VLHGNRTYLMQDANGQIIETHSISAGLDYPGVGPEHSYLKDSGRAEYVAASMMMKRCRHFMTCVGLKASSRRWSQAMPWLTRKRLAPTLPKDQVILVNLSGRGDKDIPTVATLSGIQL
jgi:tryptophan synthase beta chain